METTFFFNFHKKKRNSITAPQLIKSELRKKKLWAYYKRRCKCKHIATSLLLSAQLLWIWKPFVLCIDQFETAEKEKCYQFGNSVAVYGCYFDTLYTETMKHALDKASGTLIRQCIKTDGVNLKKIFKLMKLKKLSKTFIILNIYFSIFTIILFIRNFF